MLLETISLMPASDIGFQSPFGQILLFFIAK